MLCDPLLCILDLEFTDVSLAEASATTPRLVEIGCVKVNQELEILDEFEALVHPGNLSLFTEFSETLTGISKAELEQAPSFTEVWERFAAFTNFNKIRLCSWGIDADISVLKHAYFQHKLGYPHNVSPLDAFSFYYAKTVSIGYKVTSRSLSHACDRFGVVNKKKHRALSDAISVQALLRKLYDFEEEEDDLVLIEA